MTHAFTFDALEKGRAVHGFFTRKGGVSRGLYEGLNCGVGSGDDHYNVAENRRLVAAHVAERRVTPVLSCYQVHSANCITVISPWDDDERPEGDAMVTNKPGIILGILTADCAPILFYEPASNIIGAAHAGWQGAVKGVIENTVQAMEKLGANRKNIISAVGPCIQQSSYEVDQSFKAKALALNPTCEGFFMAGRDAKHYQFDLFSFVHQAIEAAGLAPAVSAQTPYDTYADESLFYSFRRATHQKEPDYGRQIAAIMLKP